MSNLGKLARIAAGAGTAVVLGTALSAPAAAQPGTPVLSTNIEVYDIAIGVDESSDGMLVALDLYENIDLSDRPDTVTVEVDTSPAAGVLVVGVNGPGCATTGMVTTCEVPLELAPFNVMHEALTVNLKVAAGATVGDVGTIATTVTGDGYAPSTVEHPVEVMESGDQLFGNRVVGPEAAPGDVVPFRPMIRNVGDQTTDIVAIEIDGGRYVQPVDQFRNCQPDELGGATCTVEIALAPGEAAQAAVDSVVELQIPTNTPHRHRPNVIYSAHTPPTAPETDPADGPLFELVKIPAADFGAGRELGSLDLSVGDNPSDVAAVGAEISGAVGDIVDVTLEATNDGPADVQGGRGQLPSLLLTFPEGVKVLEMGQDEGAHDDGPRLCLSVVGGATKYMDEPEGLDYVCDFGALPAGERASFTFQVEITSDAPATGSAEVVGDFPDPNQDNQLAEILLHPSGGGGGGGDLPVTGPRTLITAAGGAAVLVAGLALFLVARQRRVRVVAPTD